MKSVVTGAIAAILIAILGAVVLSGLGMTSADVFTTSNVRL